MISFATLLHKRKKFVAVESSLLRFDHPRIFTHLRGLTRFISRNLERMATWE